MFALTKLACFASAAVASVLLASPARAAAQKAAPVPLLDLNKFTGTWYEVERLPDKAEKRCITDNTVLYALNDRPNALQIGTFCIGTGGDQENLNRSATMDKARDGKLKVRRLVLLSRPYWVLAVDPQYTWALVGTPNHKSLWILARQPSLSVETTRRLQDTASAEGFAVAKLMPVAHPHDRVTLASPSANPSQVESPPTATAAPASPQR